MHLAEHVVEHADGRRLHVLERGAEGGLAVIVHHGTPGAGLLMDEHVALAADRGARLIGYDRPGYGGSDPDPGRTVASCARDVEAIADALGIERFVTWGVSGGGPHALACAALLPDRVAAAATLASVGPDRADGLDFLAGMGEDNVVEFGRAREGRASLEPFLAAMAPELLAASPEQVGEMLQSILGEPDRAVYHGGVAEYFVATLRDGLAPGIDGWVDDDLAFVAPWGFDLAGIRVPVLLLQGEQDLMVPPQHGRWLAGRIPGVDARILAGDGHLTLEITRMPDVLDWLLERL